LLLHLILYKDRSMFDQQFTLPFILFHYDICYSTYFCLISNIYIIYQKNYIFMLINIFLYYTICSVNSWEKNACAKSFLVNTCGKSLFLVVNGVQIPILYSLRFFLSVFLACIFRFSLTVLFVFLGYDLSIIPFFNYS